LPPEETDRAEDGQLSPGVEKVRSGPRKRRRQEIGHGRVDRQRPAANDQPEREHECDKDESEDKTRRRVRASTIRAQICPRERWHARSASN